MTVQSKAVGESAANSIAKKRIDQLKRAGITFNKIAQELSALAFSNIEDYIEVAEGGEVNAIALDRISSKKLKAVKKIKEKTNIAESKDGETIFKRMELEYELYDKADVLKYCVKLLGEEPAEMVNHTIDLSPELDAMVNKILSNGAKSLIDIPKNGNGKRGKVKK